MKFKVFSILLTTIFASHAETTNFEPGRIVATEIKGAVLVGATKTPIKSGEKISEGIIQTESDSSITLLFSNGTVLTVDENTKLEITEFKQAGKFEVGSVEAQIPNDGLKKPLNKIESEPSISQTNITLYDGTLTAQVKHLHEKSYFFINNLLGTLKVIGTKWRQSNKWNPNSLTLTAKIEMSDGFVEFTPTKTRREIGPQLITRNEQLTITGLFQNQLGFENFNIADISAMDIEMSLVRTTFREGDIVFTLPSNDSWEIGLIDAPLEVLSPEFNGDQGIGDVGTAPFNSVPLPNPPPPAS